MGNENFTSMAGVEEKSSSVRLTGRKRRSIVDMRGGIPPRDDLKTYSDIYERLAQEPVGGFLVTREGGNPNEREYVVVGPPLNAKEINAVLYFAAPYKNFGLDTDDILNDWRDIFRNKERLERHGAMPGWGAAESSIVKVGRVLESGYNRSSGFFKNTSERIVPIIHWKESGGKKTLLLEPLDKELQTQVTERSGYSAAQVDGGMGIVLLAAYSPDQTQWPERSGYKRTGTQPMGPTQVMAFAMRRVAESQLPASKVPATEDIQKSPLLAEWGQYLGTGKTQKEKRVRKAFALVGAAVVLGNVVFSADALPQKDDAYELLVADPAETNKAYTTFRRILQNELTDGAGEAIGAQLDTAVKDGVSKHFASHAIMKEGEKRGDTYQFWLNGKEQFSPYQDITIRRQQKDSGTALTTITFSVAKDGRLQTKKSQATYLTAAAMNRVARNVLSDTVTGNINQLGEVSISTQTHLDPAIPTSRSDIVRAAQAIDLAHQGKSDLAEEKAGEIVDLPIATKTKMAVDGEQAVNVIDLARGESVDQTVKAIDEEFKNIDDPSIALLTSIASDKQLTAQGLLETTFDINEGGRKKARRIAQAIHDPTLQETVEDSAEHPVNPAKTSTVMGSARTIWWQRFSDGVSMRGQSVYRAAATGEVNSESPSALPQTQLAKAAVIASLEDHDFATATLFRDRISNPQTGFIVDSLLEGGQAKSSVSKIGTKTEPTEIRKVEKFIETIRDEKIKDQVSRLLQFQIATNALYFAEVYRFDQATVLKNLLTDTNLITLVDKAVASLKKIEKLPNDVVNEKLENNVAELKDAIWDKLGKAENSYYEVIEQRLRAIEQV